MTDRWFSPGTAVTSTNETGRHDVTEISLKVALNTKPRDQCAKYGFIRGVTSADVMCYIIPSLPVTFYFQSLKRRYAPRRIKIGCLRMHPVAFLKLALNINQSINQSINQAINQSINQSIKTIN